MTRMNCSNCVNLGYEHDEAEYTSRRGKFVCEKRENSPLLEENLNKDSYRDKSKVCFERK